MERSNLDKVLNCCYNVHNCLPIKLWKFERNKRYLWLTHVLAWRNEMNYLQYHISWLPYGSTLSLGEYAFPEHQIMLAIPDCSRTRIDGMGKTQIIMHSTINYFANTHLESKLILCVQGFWNQNILTTIENSNHQNTPTQYAMSMSQCYIYFYS